MDSFTSLINTKATSYLGYVPNETVVDLAIETFIDLRNYPNNYDQDKILADLDKNKSKKKNDVYDKM